MNAFAGAIDAMFADPNIAIDALWRTGGAGDGQQVRVIRKKPQEDVGYRDTKYDLTAILIDVRLSEVAAPAQGDTVEIEGEVVEIISLERLDGAGYVQTCGAAAV